MTRFVALIDYGSGNLRSAEKALARAANESASGHEIVVTADPNVVAEAELRNPITDFVGRCCARATSGHATPAPAIPLMKSRRLIAATPGQDGAS